MWISSCQTLLRFSSRLLCFLPQAICQDESKTYKGHSHMLQVHNRARLQPRLQGSLGSKARTTSCWKSERCARQLLSSRILRERSSWWMMGGSALCRKLRPATTLLSIDTIISLSSITCRTNHQLRACSYQLSMSSVAGTNELCRWY